MNDLRTIFLAITVAIMALGSSSVLGGGFGGFSEKDLRGCFNFRFSGKAWSLDLNTFVPVSAVGLLTMPDLLEGGGEEDCNPGEIKRRGIRTISIGIAPPVKDQTFTCCIALGQDGRASARCPLDDSTEDAPEEEHFDAVLSRAGGVRTFFLSGTDPGVVITGEGRSQTNFSSACQEVDVNGGGGGSIL